MWILILGCFAGDPNGETPYCEETATPIAGDETTALGFAADDLLALAEGMHEAPLTWALGETTTLAVTVSDAGESRFVESVAVYPDSGQESPAIGVVCEDRVEVDVALSLVAADGSLDEAWSLALHGVTANAASFTQTIDPATAGGTHDYAADAAAQVSDYEEFEVTASGRFDATQGATGSLDGQASGTDACDGDECTAWATNFVVATWGDGVTE